MAEYTSKFSGPEIDAGVEKALMGTTTQEATMFAEGWIEKEYSFEALFPSDQYDIEVSVSGTATAEQFEAFSGALIGSNAQRNVAVAVGDVPSVDIPVVIKAVKK